MRVLDGFGQDIPRRHREVLPMPFELVFGPHLWDRADDFVPHLLGGVGIDSEATHLGPGRRAAGPELEPAVGDQIQHGGALRDSYRMVHRWQADRDSMSEMDTFGAS